MQKNVSGQKIGCQMVSASDGSAFTGAVTVSVTGDAGTQATGSVGAGACTHEGNGYHTYAPAQAETNYDLIAFTFTGSGAVPATVQVYTRWDANLTHSAGTAVTSSGGRPEVNTTHWSGTAVGSTEVRANLINIAGSAVSTSTAQLGVNVVNFGGSAGTFSSGRPEVNTTHAAGTAWGSGAITAGAFAAGAIDAAALAADAGTEIGTAVWASATRTLTSLSGLTVDTVTTVTNQLTAAQIAAGVWQDTTAGNYTVANSIGKSVMNGVALGTGLTVARCTLTDTLTTYTGNTPQTGDSFARIGATGSGLTSLAPASTALSTATWTGTRAGYLDNLSGGAVALASGVNLTSVLGVPMDFGTTQIGANITGIDAAMIALLQEALWTDHPTRTLTALDEDSTTMDLDATIRNAVGLASANLDTQLDALPTAVENADALLGRNVAGGSSTGRTVSTALYVLRNKVSISGGTMTVYQVDDTTSSWTATLTSDAAADPITVVDPG